MLNILFQHLARFNKYLPFLLFTLIPIASFSQKVDPKLIFEKANRFYQETDYKNAYKLYKKLDSLSYQSGELFYNLGNAAYKINSIGEAIFYYEKARKFFGEGADEDVELNLELAKFRMIDKIDNAPKSFFAILLGGFLDFFSMKFLAWILGVFSWLFCAVLILDLRNLLPLSKISSLLLKTSLFVFVLFLGTTFFLKSVDTALQENAVVLTQSISVKSEPNKNAKTLFVIHEGLKVQVEQHQETWIEIRLPDGNKGWVDKSAVGFL